jgi:hypothetical protein
LAEDVLALHDAIQHVLVVENRAGDMHVVDQAGRSPSPFSENMNGPAKDSTVAPAMILGAASQFGTVWRYGQLRLVGMLYAELGALCAPIDDNSYLMVTTPSEETLTVMNSLQDNLPNLLQTRTPAREKLAIISATDVDAAIRSFFANTKLCDPNQVRMERADLNAERTSWQVAGSYRPPHAIRFKRYSIELDARTGAVTKFDGRV